MQRKRIAIHHPRKDMLVWVECTQHGCWPCRSRGSGQVCGGERETWKHGHRRQGWLWHRWRDECGCSMGVPVAHAILDHKWVVARSSRTTRRMVSRNSAIESWETCWAVAEAVAGLAARLVSACGPLRAWSAGDTGGLAAAWLLAVGFGGAGWLRPLRRTEYGTVRAARPRPPAMPRLLAPRPLTRPRVLLVLAISGHWMRSTLTVDESRMIYVDCVPTSQLPSYISLMLDVRGCMTVRWSACIQQTRMYCHHLAYPVWACPLVF